MGLRLIISEIVGNINQMKTGIKETGVNYESALQVIQDFSQNTAFQSEAWTAAKNNIFEAHQSIVKGTVALHNIIDTDLGNLEEIIGAEDLDEDVLLFEIQKLQEECQHYEDMIKKLAVMNNLWRINGFGGVGLEGLITFYSALLLKTQIVLKIMEDKLESLREKAAITATLFGSVEGLAQALENAIRDAEIYITGEGVPSDGSWKETIQDYLEEDIYTQLVNEETLTKIGIEIDKMKEAYGENVIEELRQCLKEFEITDKTSIAMFLATMVVESGNGKYLLENGDGGTTYTEAVRGVGLLQITGDTQKQFLEDMMEKESDPELKEKLEQYYSGFCVYKNTANGDNNVLIDEKNCAEFIAEEYPIYSSVWFWKECEKFSHEEMVDGKMEKVKESMDEFIVRKSQTAKNMDNLFLFVQMRHNGTRYGDDALERFCEYEEDAVVVHGCLRNKETEHYAKTGYCFTIPEEPERHDNGPNGWDERKAAWDKIKEKLN